MSEASLAPPDLTGRTALVTGAGRGVGRAVAAELASAGALVGVVARSQEQLTETIFEIESNNDAGAAFVWDLADLGAVRSLHHVIEQELGPIDILVNNAGVVAPIGPTESLAAADVQASLHLNVVAPVLLSGAVVPSMRRRGWGRIVNVSSGIVANPGAMIGGNTYALAKSALEAHSLNFAKELQGSGITVNVYRPGRVDTAMQEWIRGQDPGVVGGGLVERFTASHEAGELITPQDSARSLVVRLGRSETGCIWDVADELTVDRTYRLGGPSVHRADEEQPQP